MIKLSIYATEMYSYESASTGVEHKHKRTVKFNRELECMQEGYKELLLIDATFCNKNLIFKCDNFDNGGLL